MQQHAASFTAYTDASPGSVLASFIRDEFDVFFDCGIRAHGFLRLRCCECNHDKLQAVSCKWCGACRRAACWRAGLKADEGHAVPSR